MAKFKVGDRVRRVDRAGGSLAAMPVGYVGTVTQIDPHYGLVHVDGNGGLYDHRFEPYDYRFGLPAPTPFETSASPWQGANVVPPAVESYVSPIPAIPAAWQAIGGAPGSRVRVRVWAGRSGADTVSVPTDGSVDFVEALLQQQDVKYVLIERAQS